MREFLHWRVLAIIAVVCGALYANTKLVAHHEYDNPFIQLFTHLMPEPLLVPGSVHQEAEAHGAAAGVGELHGQAPAQSDAGAGESSSAETSHSAETLLEELIPADPLLEHAPGAKNLLEVPLPGFLSIFDMTGHKDHPRLVATNLQIFQVSAVLLLFLCFGGVPNYLRTGRGDLVSRFFAGWAHWLRDDVVYSVMGPDLGARWLPFFLAIFFFVLFMNLQGLLPYGSTATASVFVTGGLAAITFTCMLVFGMKEQGIIGYWKNLVPHVPAWMWPLMFVVELMGVIVKPVALMLRLFATMMGGHLVLLTFMALLFFVAGEAGLNSVGTAYAISPFTVGFAVFSMVIEAFVVLLQAFIFTQLSVIFINAAVHPEH